MRSRHRRSDSLEPGTITRQFLFPKILTKDSVTVFVNAIMYYKVANAIHAVANVDNYGESSRLLAATTLRNVLGTLTLGDILSQRESLARQMRVTFSLLHLSGRKGQVSI